MKKPDYKIFGVVGVILALALFSGNSAQALTFTTLHSFYATRADGADPSVGLIADSGGNLYGTTSQGGGQGAGVVYKVDTAGRETVLYTFCSKMDCTDGAVPLGALVRDSFNNLYGTTSGGGALGNGTVFKLNPTTRIETVLYSFAGLAKGDGSGPEGSLWLDSASGTLYGTTAGGGKCSSRGGCGTVFSLGPRGNETVLYRFTGKNDGGSPEAGVVRIGSATYGTTISGGPSHVGVVFGIVSGVEKTIYSFTGGADGGYPLTGGLLELGGALYGTTQFGGVSGNGAIFRLIYIASAKAWKESVLADVGSAGECSPGNSGVTFDPILNYFYLSTNSCGKYGNGTVLRVDMRGKITMLYNFRGGTDGKLPEGTLLYRKGQSGTYYLYGTAFGGGKFGAGTVFRLTLP